MMEISLCEKPFVPGDILAQFSQAVTDGGGDTGGVATFLGYVRNDGGDLEALKIQHYPEMTEKALHKIAAEARLRWSLIGVRIIHRHGRLEVGEPIVMVCTAASHRREAFEAAEFIMDFLKSRAPFWKKEIRKSGEIWVAGKHADEDALTRWGS